MTFVDPHTYAPILDSDTGLPLPLSQRRKRTQKKSCVRPLLFIFLTLTVLVWIVKSAVSAGYMSDIIKYQSAIKEASKEIKAADRTIDKLNEQLEKVKQNEKTAEKDAAYYEGVAEGLKSSKAATNDTLNKFNGNEQDITVHNVLEDTKSDVPAIISAVVDAVETDREFMSQAEKETAAKDMVSAAVKLETAAMELADEAKKMVGVPATDALIDAE